MKGIFILLIAVVLGVGLLRAQPVITTDLTNQITLNGGSVTFAVGASGTGPFTYQWQFNGTNLPNNIINVITTVVGSSYMGFEGDGELATNAGLYKPYGVTADNYGNIYIADTYDNRIRIVGTNGIITTIAGNGTNAPIGNGGAATNAGLFEPQGVAVDAYGDIFIADTDNNLIREVNTNGIISIVAGIGTNGFAGDGEPATNAILDQPFGIAVDSYGNLYIADSGNKRIREVNTNGIINTVAGCETNGFGGDGGSATVAELDEPLGITVDSYGNIYFADSGNNRIREVNINGIINTVAGGGGGGDGVAATNASLSGPAGVAIDAAGNLYIADKNDNRIRQVNTTGIITTIAGDGNPGFLGDTGAAANAMLNAPSGVAVSSSGSLYIADTLNDRIRAVAPGTLPFLSLNGVTTNNVGNYQVIITSSSGSVTSSVVTLSVVLPPQSLAVTNGSPAQFTVSAFGNGPFGYQWYDGANAVEDATNTTLFFPDTTATNAGDYFCVVTNAYNSITSSVAVLTVLIPPSIVTEPTNQFILNGSNVTFAVAASGSGPLTYQWQFNGTNLPNNVISTVAGNGTNAFVGDGGLATNGEIDPPGGVAADSQGNFYIADTGNDRIRMVNTNGIITTVVGTGLAGGLGQSGGDGGPATNAYLYYPSGVAVDQYRNLFVADTYNNRIQMVNTNGIITTVAGGNLYPGFGGDGEPARYAELYRPYGVAVDKYDDIFIADTYNQRVRKIDTNDIITTLAGTNSAGYSGDGGPATNAVLDGPFGMALDAYGDLFFADQGNNCIREINTNGIINTVAGGGSGGDGGVATNASLSSPSDVAVDAWGNLFIADQYDNRIREVTVNGIITTVAGTGNVGFSGDGGTATNANLYYPRGVTINNYGGLYVADTGNNRIRSVTLGRLPFLTLNGVTTNNTGNYQVIVTSPYGSVTSSVISLSVVFPVTIAFQPQSLVVTNGNLAQLSVTASGTGPLDYQWYDGGNGVLGATNSTLIFPDAMATNAGNYTCDISNTYSTVTSRIAVLTVLTPPLITIQPVSQTVNGNNATFNVSVSGTGPFTYQWQSNGTNLPGNNTIYLVAGSELGTGTAITSGVLASNYQMGLLGGVALDSTGDIFIADQENNCIRMVRTNYIFTVAGGAGAGYSGDGGLATKARLSLNTGPPSAVAVDSLGNLYIADVVNNRIRKVNTNGIIVTIAGTNTAGFSGDGGLAINAKLSTPHGLAIDTWGDVYVADTGNNRIREINTNGIIMTVAGTNSAGFSGDGSPAIDAKLSVPAGVAVDAAGNLLIADENNNRVRKVDLNGIITTLAGGGISGDGGPATSAGLDQPYGVAVDAYDDVFIADYLNRRVRMVNTAGIISTVAGDGMSVYSGDGGNATNAEISTPISVGVDSYGNLYLASIPESPVRQVNLGRVPTLQLTNLTAANTGNFDVIVTTPYGSVTSSVVSLNVLLPPAVVVQPDETVASIGDPVTFSVTATNNPPFGYQWYASSGRTAYAIPDVTLQGMITFIIVTDGGQGYVTSPQVHFIDSQGFGGAAIANVSNGEVTSITRTSSGNNYTSSTTIQIDPPPIIAVPLPDETNATLTFPSLTQTEYTNYFVVITNAYGGVTSDIVTVFPPDPPTSFSVQNVGTGFQLTFNYGTPNYPYILQSATNLTPPVSWTPIATNNVNDFGVWQYTDTNANGIQEFYRIVSQ